MSECVTLAGLDYALLTIPKVAATSIRTALLRSNGVGLEDGQVHRHPALVRVDGAPFVATFVRHPFDRLVSCWADRIRGPRPSAPLEVLGFEATMSFADFVEHLDTVMPDADLHTRPQVEYLMPYGRWLPDFVGRFERLEDDWVRIRALTGLGPLPRLNLSTHGPWQEHFDPHTRAIAHRMYEDDLRLLGYDA